MLMAFLTFGPNKAKAGEHMAGHNSWIAKGFEDGVFLLAGSLVPGKGGAVLAHNISLEEFKVRLQDDPFVSERIVDVELQEIDPKRTDDRLAFLVA